MASGFRTRVAGVITDLDDLLDPGSGGSSTGYKVSGGSDLSSRYDPSVGGDQLSFDTGFKLSTGDDLKLRFKKLLTTPIITSQPSNYTGNEGDNYTLSLTADGAPTLTYDWQKSNDGVTGWTSVSPGNGSSSYTKINPPPLDLYYRCVVANSYGSVNSSVVHVIVHTDPYIVTNPTGFSATDGTGPYALQCEGGGDGTLQFEWFQDGVSIVGPRNGNIDATHDQQVWNPITFADAGNWHCQVTNSYGGTPANSSTATVTVT